MSCPIHITGLDPDTAAASWLLRQEQGLSAEEALLFEQWLHGHPAHLKAWQAMQDINQLIAAMPASCAQHFSAQRKALAANARRDLWKQRLLSLFSPRLVVGYACSAMVCGYIWLSMPSYQQALQTARGEMRQQILPDGSRIELDTDSQLEVALYRDKREVRLIKGQAMFYVSKGRPFHVLTKEAKVSVLGTQFSVRDIQHNTQVAVQSGRVAVYRAQSSAAGVILHGGETVSLLKQQLSAVEPISPAAVGSWRQGRLTFDNTKLADAIAEFERYADTGLSLANGQIGELRISGSFEINKLQQFTRALPQVLPVQIKHGEISRP